MLHDKESQIMPRIFIIPAGIPQPRNKPCLRQYVALKKLFLSLFFLFLGLWFCLFFFLALGFFTFFSFTSLRFLFLENLRFRRTTFCRRHRFFLHRRDNRNQN